MENKSCKRCSKNVELQKNSSYYNAKGMWGDHIKRDLNLKLDDKYFVDLCNNCSEILEYALTAFYNCRTNARDVTVGKLGDNEIKLNSLESGIQGKYLHDASSQTMKIWENNKVWEFNTQSQSLDAILKSMNF